MWAEAFLFADNHLNRPGHYIYSLSFDLGLATYRSGISGIRASNVTGPSRLFPVAHRQIASGFDSWLQNDRPCRRPWHRHLRTVLRHFRPTK